MSHKPLCIIWDPISYYFFGFDLLGLRPSPAARSHTAQLHSGPHFPRLTRFPKRCCQCSFLGFRMALFSPTKIRSPELPTWVSSSSFSNISSNVPLLMKLYLNCLIPSPHPGAFCPLPHLLLATYHHLPQGGNSFSHPQRRDQHPEGRCSSVFSL